MGPTSHTDINMLFFLIIAFFGAVLSTVAAEDHELKECIGEKEQ